jgi:hypothetical protein
MLFTCPAEANHESEKERNLYAKVFVGYWFNELVPGIDERLLSFRKILGAGLWIGARVEPNLSLQETRVTLDYHEYRARAIASSGSVISVAQAGDNPDRGECADVLVMDFSTKCMVAIEAKLASDFTYDKDILRNSKRIRRVQTSFRMTTAIQCLLLARRKLEEVERHAAQRGSAWLALQGHVSEIPLVVVTWEDFAERSSAVVAEFINTHVKSSLTRNL